MRDEVDLREREEAALESERNSRRQAELLQDILSHDIRNYNQVVKSNAEMLREDLNDNAGALPDTGSLVDAIIRATDGSTQLIERAKKLARAVSTQEVQLGPTNLEASLQRAISLVTKAYDNKAVDLSVSVPTGANVLADELLDEVFTNILANAVKFTEGKEAHITIKAEEAEGGRFLEPRPGQDVKSQRCWRIDITDEGRGIPDELKEKVFTRYTTASSGSGLGLSIVHALVTGRYKGGVRIADRVENNSSEGTRIEVWIPGAF
jgi:signal transduction histidine kinase